MVRTLYTLVDVFFLAIVKVHPTANTQNKRYKLSNVAECPFSVQ